MQAKCCKCRIVIPPSERREKSTRCRKCRNAYQSAWNKTAAGKKHRASVRRRWREYYREYRKQHQATEQYKAWRRKHISERRRRDVGFRMRRNLNQAINGSLRRQGHHAWKKCSTVDLLGCSIASFKMYIESKFESGMSWDNYGNRDGCWSIDHIIPSSLFDLTNPDHQRVCFHFSNMRPMWHIENVKKSNHVTEDRQIQLPIAGL